MGEICILAGGLSTRMGRDKARMRFDGKTLLNHARSVAEATRKPVRIIRRDLIARCGPLGGVYTALSTTRADGILFLACDMPRVTVEMLQKLIRAGQKHSAVFAAGPKGAGFPFFLRSELLPVVKRLIESDQHSLQTLARQCRARSIRFASRLLININTPADWAALES